ncbi:chromate efflux transporter [Elioraea sp.]|uniref:chromate efflux transporter n=1 Tax=Elioraea sp. TaxID=2185103 RepID=UPI00307DDE2E
MPNVWNAASAPICRREGFAALGLSALFAHDDHAMLRHGFALHDALSLVPRPAGGDARMAAAGMMRAQAPTVPSLAEAARLWLMVGLLSFGGAAGQIAMMHRMVVEERRWVGERRYLNALNFCTLLPGPEAQQLATYLGWLLHGVAGGIAAGALFVLPGAALMAVLAAIYGLYGKVALVEALFFGLKGAVLAIIAEALWRIGRRALHGPVAVALAVAAFAALFAFRLPFPLVVLGAGGIGLAAGLAGRTWFTGAAHGRAGAGPAVGAIDRLLDDPASAGLHRARATTARRAGIAALVLWLATVIAFALTGGVFGDIALFFAKMAVVTFGGAYAVLAWVAQDAVHLYRWITPGEMVDGLALAETTPGPTILVLQFVAHLAAFREGGLRAGLTGGALCVFVTFAPSFAWIFLGGPSVERIAARRELASALAAITAAVVGVVANLALVVALPVLFGAVGQWRAGPVSLPAPVLSSIDPRAVIVAAAGFAGLFVVQLGLFRTLGLCAALGLALRLIV